VRVNPAIEHPSEISVLKDTYSAQTSSAQTSVPTKGPTSSQLTNPVPLSKTLTSAPAQSAPTPQNVSPDPELPLSSDNAVLFLGSAAQPQSWFGSNKYILATLVVAAVIIAAIVLFR
jgi:hypothetical protein